VPTHQVEPGNVAVVPDDVSIHLLSVLSDGLGNALRHSGCDTVGVLVVAGKEQVDLVISDNGNGF
jgi:signal transduction histidine kinase